MEAIDPLLHLCNIGRPDLQPEMTPMLSESQKITCVVKTQTNFHSFMLKYPAAKTKIYIYIQPVMEAHNAHMQNCLAGAACHTHHSYWF